ncbi:hypothetical protein CGMCC3_g16762 [Colletotrichum fructicola]|nr:uncharacterized protein CGMCC3_g16762 [Colletotrichum fructicola]KAE9567096.1 hypothetical protein CGMCC3_g16762 [Colletotrichum fructicola]
MAKIDSPPDFNVWHALSLTPPAATSKDIAFTSDQNRKAWRAGSALEEIGQEEFTPSFKSHSHKFTKDIDGEITSALR